MVAIGVRYLMGWSMATHSADRERPEWPPHPDRVFMALAAAYYETEGSDNERQALQWLERQPAPSMRAEDATYRKTLTTYVPVNDTKTELRLLPENRSRQPRQFPVSIPRDPTVYLIWPGEPSPEVRLGLDSLCDKVIRVGHSA